METAIEDTGTPRRPDLPAPRLGAVLPVLVVAFVVQALAWAGVAAGLRRVREDEEALLDAADPEAATPEAEPALFSVVVAAHDEADRLPALLGALEAQTHRLGDGTPAFEVVVVDDRSADGTADVAERWARAWTRRGGPDLRVVRVAEGAPEAAGLPPKKHAIERGIEAARHDRLALTDADCAPPPTWLEALARLGDDNAVLVGTGPLAEAPGWLNRFARYETLQTAALSAAAIGLGRPWHAVGRNLSYPASLLPRLGGFAHSAGSLSGDDDLLVQEVARTEAAPVRAVLDPEAAVPSPAPAGWRAFWRQKRRHASAGSHYPASVLVGLGVSHTSNLALWIGAPVLHLVGGLPAGWGLLAAKLLLQRAVLLPFYDRLGAETDLRLWQPLLDGLSAIYHAVFAVLGALPTPRRW